MVFDECHHTGGVGVEVVVAERVVQAVHATPPVIGLLMLGRVEFLLEREVHDGLQVAVLVRQLGVFLPGSGIGGVGHPRLADGVEVGIFLVQLLHPLCHRLTVGIGIGVHTDAVDAYGLYPPDAVLDEVAHQVRILLVQVGHGRYEPSLYCLALIDFRGVRVEHRCQFVAGLQEVGAA